MPGRRGSKRSIPSARSACASAFAGLALAASPAAAQEDAPPPPSDLSVSLGASAWHGSFGAPTETDIASVLLGVRYRTGGLRLTATLPWMRIRSDGSFFAGIGGTPLFVAPGIRPARRVREGLGDLTLGAAYLLPGGEARGFDLELAGRVKLPTASDSSGLSTGKVDYSFGGTLSKTLGRLTPSVSATYRIYGDNPSWSFRNGVELSAGASYALTDRTVILASYDYVQASSRFIRDSHELVAGLSTPLGQRLRLTRYASKGLSDGAAAVSGGLSLTATF